MKNIGNLTLNTDVLDKSDVELDFKYKMDSDSVYKNGKFINKNTGKLISMSNYAYTDPIPLSNGFQFYFTTTAMENIASWAVYDEKTLSSDDATAISVGGFSSSKVSFLKEYLDVTDLYRNGAKYIRFSSQTTTLTATQLQKTFSKDTNCKDMISSIVCENTYDKNLVWIGTSIPASKLSVAEIVDNMNLKFGYPELVAKKLSMGIHNFALGNSVIRANCRTGNYLSAPGNGMLYSFTQTLEEKQYIIDNYSMLCADFFYKSSSATPTLEWVNKNQKNIKNTSFEHLLMPILSGDNVSSMVFILDHGYNDAASYYKTKSGITDISLYPSTSNVGPDKEIAEDTYMISNDCENLKRFVGSLDGIPADKRASFVASLNRNCFYGAMNFIATVILHHNPTAEIFVVEEKEKDTYAALAETENNFASSWDFPIVPLANKLYMNNVHYIPGTAKYWDKSGTTDKKLKSIYCKDTVHPSDKAIIRISQVIADFIKPYII